MATDNICRYLNGRHEMPPRSFCPHFEYEDETGFRINPSWTVQMDRDWSTIAGEYSGDS
jgi:hypothetical protein